MFIKNVDIATRLISSPSLSFIKLIQCHETSIKRIVPMHYNFKTNNELIWKTSKVLQFPQVQQIAPLITTDERLRYGSVNETDILRNN